MFCKPILPFRLYASLNESCDVSKLVCLKWFETRACIKFRFSTGNSKMKTGSGKGPYISGRLYSSFSITQFLEVITITKKHTNLVHHNRI